MSHRDLRWPTLEQPLTADARTEATGKTDSPDPAELTVAEIQVLDLSATQWAGLLEKERRATKPRKAVVEFAIGKIGELG